MTKRNRISGRSAWRVVLVAVISVGSALSLFGIVTDNHNATDAGFHLTVGPALLFLWLQSVEVRERIAELEIREKALFKANRMIGARTAELMHSAWRNDAAYRDQRQKHEAQEKQEQETRVNQP